MTTPRDPDEILAAWLDEGPTRIPDQTRRAIAVAIPTTTQRRRGWTAPWRQPSMVPLARAALGAVAVLAVALGAAFILDPGTSIRAIGGAPTPSATPSIPNTSPALSPSLVPTRPTLWVPFTSSRYGFTGAYPTDWTLQSSQRAWTYESDATDPVSPAHDAFLSPDGDVRVSVWSIPFHGGATVDTVDFEAWIESYCQKTDNAPCTGIHERAVPLCIERRDCHFSLLVPFQDDVQAFLSGGIYPGDRMTIVAIWRGESDPAVAKYGGARQVLEAFLSTMGVWPQTVPFEERQVRNAPVTP